MVDKRAYDLVEYPLKKCDVSADRLARYIRCYLRYFARCLLKKVEPLDFDLWFMEIGRLHEKANPSPPKRRVKIIDATKIKKEESLPQRVKKRVFR